MRKSIQNFSKDINKLEGYPSFNMQRSERAINQLSQVSVYMASDDEEYFFEVEDY